MATCRICKRPDCDDGCEHRDFSEWSDKEIADAYYQTMGMDDVEAASVYALEAKGRGILL